MTASRDRNERRVAAKQKTQSAKFKWSRIGKFIGASAIAGSLVVGAICLVAVGSSGSANIQAKVPGLGPVSISKADPPKGPVGIRLNNASGNTFTNIRISGFENPIVDSNGQRNKFENIDVQR